MAEPLNQTLYRQLQRVFGHVKISNEGEAMISEYVQETFSGRWELRISNTGEYYQACCPRCHDTSFRLYVNHRWGVRDDLGRRNLWLVICMNEDCYDTREAREDLLDTLSEIAGVLEHANIAPGKRIVGHRPTELPGPVYQLDTLPPDHPANVYLAGRNYDPERLGRNYGVGYCPNSHLYLARNRIVAPVRMQGELRGWQARCIGDFDWKARDEAGKPIYPPKWWSDPNMKKRLVLYNYDQAITYRTGVLVEGPGDVWGFGPMALATLGASFSDQQLRLLRPFRDGSMVLLWDPDLQKDPKTLRAWEKALTALRTYGFHHGVAGVVLPDGTDPGKLDRVFQRDYVAQAAKDQGVKVDWRLK